MNYLIEVKTDCFNIAKRIKEINKNYKLFFNVKNNRYEVYTDYGVKIKRECVFQIKSLGEINRGLTAEVIIKLLKTRRENADLLIREIDMENEKQYKQKIDTTIKEFQKILERI